MLRLKGERDDDALREDEVRPRVDVEETDELTRKDVFPGAGSASPADEADDAAYPEYDSGRPGGTLPFRGFAIATAAFAPTFLLVFFGLPYLVGSAVPARTPRAPVSSSAPQLEPKAFPSLSEAARGDSRGAAGDLRSGLPQAGLAQSGLPQSTPPQSKLPQSNLDDTRGGLGGRMTTDPSRTTSPVPDEPKVEERATAVAPEPIPSLPPAPTAPAVAPEPRVPEPSRSASASPPAPEPRAAAAEPRRAPREPREWTPAAAFTDRAAAGRLASSIEKQGYPVEIRQDSSSSRPWVVWIGAQPSGGARRR